MNSGYDQNKTMPPPPPPVKTDHAEQSANHGAHEKKRSNVRIMADIVFIGLFAIAFAVALLELEYIRSLKDENAELEDRIKDLRREARKSDEYSYLYDDGEDSYYYDPDYDGIDQYSVNPTAFEPGYITEDGIKIIAEYTLPGLLYQKHIIIIGNTTEETLAVKTSSLAYDSEGNPVSAANAKISALGSNYISYLIEDFDTDEVISSYETTVSCEEPSFIHSSAFGFIDGTVTEISNGVIIQATNNTDRRIDDPYVLILFFYRGELVDAQETSLASDYFSLKAGETVNKQVTCYETFDEVDTYVGGENMSL